MDRKVDGVSVPVVNIPVFHELLDKLRSAHEEVCSRNALLERRAGCQSLSQTLEDDPWKPIHFLPPKDTPAPRSLPWVSQNTFAPKASDLKYLCQRIDDLAQQQEKFGEQLTRLHAVNTCQGIDELAQHQENLGEQPTRLHAVSVTPPHVMYTNINRESTELVSQGSVDAIPHAISGNSIGASQATADSVFTVWGANSGRFKVKLGNTREFGGQMSAIGTERYSQTPEFRECRANLRRVLGSNTFNASIALLIVSYAILIGIETDMVSQDPELDSAELKHLHNIFNICFCMELLLRIFAHGWATWCGVDAVWNRLDTFLVVSALLEMFMENVLGFSKSIGVMKGVRIARMIRTVRLVRVAHQFHDFQKMSHALLSSMRTLCCSMLILMFVTFFFAVWLTQSAADVNMRDTIQDLELRYGRLMSTVYTLFLSVSNGISWDLCFMPLHEMSWLSGQIFICYVVIVLFGVLNVVTSVFVESVLRSVQHQRQLIVQDKEEEKRIAMEHIKEVFHQLDGSGTGSVSIHELEFFLKDPSLCKYMDALSIEAEDTRLLFRMLDADNSGLIDIHEFVDGCIRLKGQAKSIDVHILNFRLKSFLDMWNEFTEYVDNALTKLASKNNLRVQRSTKRP